LPIASVLRYQDYQFQVSLTSGQWKWTTRVDVSGSQVATHIRDVISPFGLLRDSIPIPGEVAQAMADSISQVVNTYAPSILLSPSALTFVVDEGRGVSSATQVHVTNNGILGSLLSAQVTSNVSYVAATPANIGGLVSNASGSFDVSVNSTELVASASPYAAVLKVQGATAVNTPQEIPVIVTVRPKATIVTSITNVTFTVTAPLNGRFPPVPSQIVGLTNTGPTASLLSYQVRRLVGAPWLVGVSPVYGTIEGGATQPLTILVSPPDGALPGLYTETLRISGYSTNIATDVVVTLHIT
jgi:hypothetical protein